MTMEGYYEMIHRLYMALDRAQVNRDHDLAKVIGQRIDTLQQLAPFPRPPQEA